MSILWLKGGVPKIKKLPDAECERLLKQMTPVKEVDGKLFPILRTRDDKQDVTLWNTAFTWDPHLGPELKDIELYDLARIETYHTCGYIALFKPSLGEVLSQIPLNLRADVTHFETLTHDDVVGCFSDGDGHRTVTKLYTTYSMDERIKRAIHAA